MTHPITPYISSAFSLNNTGGNKAGIVFDRPELTTKEKMKISKSLGFSESAFVTASDRADYKLEYYTPTEEVPLCGHATIASFTTMKLLGMVEAGEYRIETGAGILEVSVAEDGLVMMEQNLPQFYEELAVSEVTASMGPGYRPAAAPIQIISTGLKDIILPVGGVDALHAMKPDMAKMTELSRKWNVVGVHAFALTDAGDEVDAICRNFAPLYGIDEESATGTSSCALAGYLYRYVVKKDTYVFEQGYSLGSPSRIVVKVEASEAGIDRIFVGGYGYLAEKTEILITRNIPS